MTMYDSSAAPAGLPDPFTPATPVAFLERLHRQPRLDRRVGGGVAFLASSLGALGVLDLRYVAALAVKSIHTYRTELLHTYPLLGESGDALWFTGQPFISVRVVVDNVLSAGRIERPFMADVRARLRQYSFLGVKYIVVPR